MRCRGAKLLDLLFPAGPCSLCGNPTGWGPATGLCRACWGRRKRLGGARCPTCGKPLPAVEGQEDHACGACLADPPAFEAHASPYAYAGPVRQLVLMYKEQRRYPLAGLLGRALAREVRRRWLGWAPDGVVAVPGPLLRRVVRGFEPAGLVAREAARALRVPLLEGLRLRRTPKPQKGLTVARRRENVRSAFLGDPRLLKGKTVLLVDDVTTTGATLREGARALVRAGATVRTATFAMTLKREPDFYGAAAPGEEGQGVAESDVKRPMGAPRRRTL